MLEQDHGMVFATVLTMAVPLLLLVLRRLYWNGLSHLPGPLLGRVTNLFLYVVCYLGLEGQVFRYYHQKYRASVLRVGPNSVSVSDSAAIRDIYITSGGFPKDERYENFNLGPIRTIFSVIDNKYRDKRAKAVAPLFAPGRLRTASMKPGGAIADCVAEFVNLFHELKMSGGESRPVIDLLDLCARLCIDATTAYLVDARYGGLQEHASLAVGMRRKAKLSANPFIFAIVRFARFSLLPGWLFRLAYRVSSWLSATKEVSSSFAQLDRFAEETVQRSINDVKADTYQRRLLDVGVSAAETVAQVKAIVFAGADSVAVMLATILFHLVRNDAVRDRLCGDVQAATGADPLTLPYLRAVVKEGLRLGMANPTRLTRVVPPHGLNVAGTHLPGGTVVGCAAYVLHHDPDIFPEPFCFRPERWLEDETSPLRKPNMARSWIPYGAGLRACLGKNLAPQILHVAVMAVVESDVLRGAKTCHEKIEIIDWFNAEIRGHKLEIEWPS